MTIEQLKALPKAELHCHLDGSLSRKFMERQLGRRHSRKSLACPMTAQALQNTWRNFRFRVSVLWMKKGLRQLATMYFAP